MGIYDRDYVRDEPPRGFFLGGPRMMVTNLVLINVAVYVAQLLFRSDGSGFTDLFSLHKDLFTHPWQCYQLLTYGFLHDPDSIWHILGNMLILWFLGREVEELYGQRTFLQFYLSTIVLAGLAWAALENLASPGGKDALVLGASGGVCGVAAVFVMHYPRRLVYLYFVIPVPIWLVAVAFLVFNAYATMQHQGAVATSAHLAGAGLGYLFYRTQWHLGVLFTRFWPRGGLRRGPRIHRPAEVDDDDAQLKAEVDRILEKISRQGEASLTSRERGTLEDASRRYQQRGR